MCNLNNFVIKRISCTHQHLAECSDCGHGIFEKEGGKISHSHCDPQIHENQCICGCVKYQPEEKRW